MLGGNGKTSPRGLNISIYLWSCENANMVQRYNPLLRAGEVFGCDGSELHSDEEEGEHVPSLRHLSYAHLAGRVF